MDTSDDGIDYVTKETSNNSEIVYMEKLHNCELLTKDAVNGARREYEKNTILNLLKN